MKQLKLEVGKTYRNRNGEEVKIVGNIGGCESPYKGSNGEWYTESGRWEDFCTEHPEDLIEEVPETRHAFDIPNGVKKVTVEQVGNRIIVEMVPEEGPKRGDVMINEQGSVYIFKSAVNDYNHEHFAWLGEFGSLYIGATCHPGRPATPEEAQPLWDALKKAGKRWNAETMQVEEVAERERIMAFLQGYANKVTWDCRQLCLLIEAYLKHKEDEK